VPAIWKRVLQFRAGPESHTFYACDAHRPELERGDLHSGLFFGRPADAVEAVDPEDEIACDLCREG
jgi:hypothetical protein